MTGQVATADRAWLADLVLANAGIRISATLAIGGWGKGIIVVRPGADKAGKCYSVALSRAAREVLHAPQR